MWFIFILGLTFLFQNHIIHYHSQNKSKENLNPVYKIERQHTHRWYASETHYYLGVAQIEKSRSLVLIQSCNRHAIPAKVNKPSKQANWREWRLAQGINHAGKKVAMNMLKQRRDEFKKKDKLINLSLFILPRSRTIFRNLKENLSKIIGSDGFGLRRV